MLQHALKFKYQLGHLNVKYFELMLLCKVYKHAMRIPLQNCCRSSRIVDSSFQLPFHSLSSRVQTRPKPLDFWGVRKILSMPSFGGEVKEYVPCPSFAAC